MSEKEVLNVKNKEPKVLSIENLKELLNQKQTYKTSVENEYFKTVGQIQFITEQIKTLES